MTTYRCAECGYAQDVEMTEEMAKLHFPELPNLKAGECPSCRKGKLTPASLCEKRLDEITMNLT